jgi:hypothetical protein
MFPAVRRFHFLIIINLLAFDANADCDGLESLSNQKISIVSCSPIDVLAYPNIIDRIEGRFPEEWRDRSKKSYSHGKIAVVRFKVHFWETLREEKVYIPDKKFCEEFGDETITVNMRQACCDLDVDPTPPCCFELEYYVTKILSPTVRELKNTVVVF